MMKDRQERILIPAAMVFMSMMVTLWFSIGLKENPFQWFPFAVEDNKKEVKFLFELLIALGITNLAIGYVCKALFTLWMMIRPRERLIDLDQLLAAFGLRVKDKLYKRKIHREVQPHLLAEFHTRLHSHAPDTLIAHCTRRNSAWYVAKASAIAVWMGWWLALVIMYSSTLHLKQVFQTPITCWGFVMSLMVFLVVLPTYLWQQGSKWNHEFWDVCWKWIVWDLEKKPMQDREKWKDTLPEGIDWLSSNVDKNDIKFRTWPKIVSIILICGVIIILVLASIFQIGPLSSWTIKICNCEASGIKSLLIFALLITIVFLNRWPNLKRNIIEIECKATKHITDFFNRFTKRGK